MPERFQIQRHQNSDSLHLRLTGVFDEEAAILLVEELNRNGAGVNRIFVHTGTLDEFLSSGIDLFRSSLGSLDRPGADIIFTGKKGLDFVVKAPGIRFMK